VSPPDLNLLVALDVLLAEASVARAASRLGLSPSAMSRTLTRLRAATGDPLLVRAGRGLVATPRAIALRDRIGPIVQMAAAALQPDTHLELATLDRVFTLRVNEGFAESFAARVLARLHAEAPNVVLRLAPKPDKDIAVLREASIDLEIGVMGEAGPEFRRQTLFRDRFVGVVRSGHLLAQGDVTPASYAAGQHISVSRRGRPNGPIDIALAALGLERRVAAIVSGFPAALAFARETDLVASVPERQTAGGRAGLHSFALPFATPAVVVAQLWHPRLDADPAHRWLRGCVRDAVAE
jgi:DNA-binding transcriptional LysR family regulator